MKRQKYPKKIKSAEQAVKLTLRLWKELEKGITDGKFEQKRHEVEGYNITVVKEMLIGHDFYRFNCPLCHVHSKGYSWEYTCGNCPLETFQKSCDAGCIEIGYGDWMTLAQVKRFRKNLEKVLKED